METYIHETTPTRFAVRPCRITVPEADRCRLEKGVLFLQINRFMEVRLPTFATLHNQADEAHAEAVSLLPFLRLVSFERSIHHDQ